MLVRSVLPSPKSQENWLGLLSDPVALNEVVCPKQTVSAVKMLTGVGSTIWVPVMVSGHPKVFVAIRVMV